VSETTVTIKYSGDRDATWVVFRGMPAQLRADIMDYFGMDPTTQAGLSLSSIVTNATQVAHGKALIATSLGATVVEETTTAPAAPAGDPWAAAASSTPVHTVADQAPADPNAWILGEIEKQTTVPGLKKLWADNQVFFSDVTVMAAWKAKGKSLQEVAA
jgi:hypothetical protein